MLRRPRAALIATVALLSIGSALIESKPPTALADTPQSTDAAAVNSLSGRIVDERQMPVAGATVVATSPAQTATTTTDAGGFYRFDSLVPGTYTIRVTSSGFAAIARPAVVPSAPDRRVVFILPRPSLTHAAKPPTALPQGDVDDRPKPAAAPPSVGSAEPPVVHDSLLGLFNAAHPVHVGKEPYYGRYSYVILRDGDAATKARNLAFVTKLVDSFAATGTRISFDDSARADSPLSYNIFFLPVQDNAAALRVSAHADAAKMIINEYSYDDARRIRAAYCRLRAHSSRSLCAIPYNTGPILYTFLRPLAPVLTKVDIPPAFAYDFSAVPVEQFDMPLATVERKIAVARDVSADDILPPPLAAHVANELDTLAAALNGAFKGVSVWIDKQPGVGASH